MATPPQLTPEQRANALAKAAEARAARADERGGRQVVATRRAMDLAAYLLALNSPHAYGPESAHNAIAAKPEHGAEEHKK